MPRKHTRGLSTPTYRALVSIALGLVGFAANFLDVELVESPTLRVSLLLGLAFPLLVAQAWGWRYGLLSALAGGCQSMWWLWASDGWGILYSVPVFTLWVTWHGYWSDRRREAGRVLYSPFLVEIPIRLAIELGFRTLFPWLVSHNPPPWDPSIAWHRVPAGWTNLVAIKHTITAYVLLLVIYVLLDVAFVRRLFRLPERRAQGAVNRVYAWGLLLGSVVWLLHSLVTWAAFNPQQQPFWHMVILANPRELALRNLMLFVTAAAAAMIAPITMQRTARQEDTQHERDVALALEQATTALTESLDPDTVLDRILEQASRAFPAFATNIALVAGDRARIVRWRGYESFGMSEFLEGFECRLDEMPIWQRVATDPHPLAIPDVRTAPDWVAHQSWLRSYAMAPIVDQGEVLGFLSLDGRAPNVLSQQDADTLGAFAERAAIAIRNARLYERAQQEIADRVRAQEALRESEAGLRALFDQAADAIYKVDLQGRIVDANAEACACLGYSRQELLTLSVLQIDASLASDDGLLAARAVLESGERLELETAFRRKDGTTFPVELRVSLIERSGQQVILCIARDVTEREGNAQQLRFQAMLMDQIRDAVTATDLEGRITYLNAAARRAMGRSAEELVGQHVTVLGEDPKEGARQQDIVDQTLAHGEWRGKVVNLSADNRRITFETRTQLVRDRDGHPIGMVGISTDITEREAAARQLLRVSAAVEQSSDGCVITDLNANIVYANRAIKDLYGYSLDDLVGRSVFLLNASDEDNARIRKAMEQDGFWSGEQEQRRKDGSTFTGLLNLFVVMDGLSRPDSAVAMVRDITEHNRLQERLRQSAKMEAVGQLAGGVAHDFNNLLTVINGYGELAMEELLPSDPLHENLSEILRAGGRAAQLTSQLLAFSRRQRMEIRVLDLNDVLRDTKRMLGRLIGEDIRLDYGLVSDPLCVRADPAQIEQVILNLAVNARDAMPEGGTLTIRTSNRLLDRHALPDAEELPPGPYATIEVRDTGVGMTREVLDHLFEPFFTTKGVGRGTGLGLATVYGIVRQLEGGITVYSEPGEGTVFHIYLPHVNAQEESPTKATPGDLPRGDEAILLVEDDAAVRRLGVQMIERWGYTVHEATNGAEALAWLKANGLVDLVLTDVVMPDMGGPELMARLKQTQAAQIPVLFMSGYPDRGTTETGGDLVGEIIGKPFDAGQLAHAIRRALDGARP